MGRAIIVEIDVRNVEVGIGRMIRIGCQLSAKFQRADVWGILVTHSMSIQIQKPVPASTISPTTRMMKSSGKPITALV